jgi:hypothetical protein
VACFSSSCCCFCCTTDGASDDDSGAGDGVSVVDTDAWLPITGSALLCSALLCCHLLTRSLTHYWRSELGDRCECECVCVSVREGKKEGHSSTVVVSSGDGDPR